MPSETYLQARNRLLRELHALGWDTRAELKRPWAEPDWKGYERQAPFRVTFHAQAVYLDHYSMWLDYRGMPVQTFIANVELWAKKGKEYPT